MIWFDNVLSAELSLIPDAPPSLKDFADFTNEAVGTVRMLRTV